MLELERNISLRREKALELNIPPPALSNSEPLSKKFERRELKLDNVCKFVLKSCIDNKFNLIAYNEIIKNKMSDRNLNRELSWKKSSLEKLAKAGFFICIDKDTYRLTDKGIEKRNELLSIKKEIQNVKSAKEFQPGPNYISLLKTENKGILDFNSILNRIDKLPREKQDRERTMKSGMIKKLLLSEYLTKNESLGIKKYFLTPKAFELIKSNQKPNAISIPKNKNTEQLSFLKENHVIKITKYDVENIIEKATKNVLRQEDIKNLPNQASILKRLHTLSEARFVTPIPEGWQLADKLIERGLQRDKINLERELSHGRNRSIELLSPEQKHTLIDLKDFLNLSGRQILNYIYTNDKTLFKSDMKYLIDKGILVKDKINDVYVLSKEGSKLSSGLTGDYEVFSSKISSRREEVRHDLMLYTAFKNVEAELTRSGKTIISIKTDRKLKSEDMKAGEQRKAYSDLQIEFIDNRTKEKDLLNLEIDLGYSEKERIKKLDIPNIVFFTNNSKEKAKIQRVLEKVTGHYSNTHEKTLKKAKYQNVFIIEEEYWKR